MEKRSFLMGLSVGRQLKGWGGSAAGLTLAPFCWNDPGVYTHFYIDYRYGLQAVSYGRFRNKTAIFGAAGEIVPTDVVAVDSHTVKVLADIAGETRLRIFGSAKPGLAYFDGTTVGAFSAELYLDGTAPYELPYLAETGQASAVAFGMEEGFGLSAAEAAERSSAEQADYQGAEVTAGETVSVSYT